MTRNLKALGLALVAIFAMSAVAASAAQAAHFVANGGVAGSSIITADADNNSLQKWTTPIGTVECNILSAKATVANSTEAATFEKILYSSNFFASHACRAFGAEATINFEECHYNFTAGTWNGTDATGTVHITCPAAQSIKIATLGCTVTVPGGQTLGSVTYTNAGGAGNLMDITLDANLAGIHLSWSGITCGSGSDVNSTYTGSITARAFEDIGGTEGGQVSLTVGA